jgi:hypothetical protein
LKKRGGTKQRPSSGAGDENRESSFLSGLLSLYSSYHLLVRVGHGLRGLCALEERTEGKVEREVLSFE